MQHTWSVFTVWFSSDEGEWVGDKPRISDKDVAWSKSKLFRDKVDDMAGTASSCGLAILESLEFLQYLRGQPAFSVKRDFFPKTQISVAGFDNGNAR